MVSPRGNRLCVTDLIVAKLLMHLAGAVLLKVDLVAVTQLFVDHLLD